MPNLRIVSNNAADRATLIASTTAGALVAANLLTDDKSTVWRATGTSARLSGTLAAAETASCVHLPFCNLSPSATIRVRATGEAAATNLLPYSEALDNAVYTKTNATIGANGIAPDGQTTARSVIDNAVAGNHSAQRTHTVAAATTYVFSMFVKPNGRTQVTLNNITLGAYANFDLTTKAVAGGGAGYVSASISAQPNGYSRISLCFTTVAAGAHNIAMFLRTAGTLSYTGDGVSGLYSWGWQLETGAAMSSYYPAVAAAATRPLGYMDAWQTYALDTGAVPACPAPARQPRGWTAAQAASAYFNGGGAHAFVYFSAMPIAGFTIDLADTNNLQGYIEAARLVLGSYWSPTYNASSAPLQAIDSTTLYRNGAGGQMADAGTIHRKVSIDLGMMPAADRTAMVALLLNSRAYPVLISVFPENPDQALERDNMIYGRRPADSDISIQYATSYATKIEVEEL